MRVLLILSFTFMPLAAGEVAAATSSYPTWDNQESVAAYALRANLPPIFTLDLGNGIKLNLVLIPAGKFMMGTAEPSSVDIMSYRKNIVIGQALTAASAAIILLILLGAAIRARRQGRRSQLSLGKLILLVAVTGGCVLSAMHWRQTLRDLDIVQEEYLAARARFDSTDDSEKPAHLVMLTTPFYMGEFVVTQNQYFQVTGLTPSTFKAGNNPVESVLWEEARAFCRKLSEQTKHTVRLPTEAEWEYACRAGTSTSYWSGGTELDLARVAWYSENGKATTHPVGQKDPNPFGLYDMHGNVRQWCEDWFDSDYYQYSEFVNPPGPANGLERVSRGGTRYDDAWKCRSACRWGSNPDFRDCLISFRIVMIPKP